MNRSVVLATAVAVPALLLSACSSSTEETAAASGTSITVNSSDTACTLSSTNGPAGSYVFDVTNSGEQITEVYVYGEDNKDFTKVVSEVENIGPGVTRSMSADLSAGTYEIACKPGQTGTGIRSTLTVTGDGAAPTASASAKQYRELSFGITAKDTLSGMEGASATVGESIEFAVLNSGKDARIFEVKRPDGTVAGEVEIPAGKEADLYVDVTVAGNWLLIVEGGKNETETTFPVK